VKSILILALLYIFVIPAICEAEAGRPQVQGQPRKKYINSLKNKKFLKRAWGLQVVEHLPSTCEVLGLIPTKKPNRSLEKL
jgi:hypothetical protein